MQQRPLKKHKTITMQRTLNMHGKMQRAAEAWREAGQGVIPESAARKAQDAADAAENLEEKLDAQLRAAVKSFSEAFNEFHRQLLLLVSR